jgi:predicted SnoaL-like aldol condensation-catalyzing enzyme
MFKEKNCVMSEENEALVHRFHMDIFQKGDSTAADEILAPDFIWRNPGLPSELKHGPEGVKKTAAAIIDAMPNRQITHDDTIVKGDKVMIRWTMTGRLKRKYLEYLLATNQ